MNEQRTRDKMPSSRRAVAPSNRLAPTDDLRNYFRDYARQRPEVVALWCFGIGFALGWKLKPW